MRPSQPDAEALEAIPITDCPNCAGEGWLFEDAVAPDNGHMTIDTPCVHCDGTGEVAA